MKHLSRVVWSEGMYLGPHHFQAQSRYFEDSIRFAVSSVWFESWGVAGCELDAEALGNGTVSLLHARGMFPDGLTFHIPDCDAAPVARNIADLFPPTRDHVTVLLAIPERKPDGANCVAGDEGSGNGAPSEAAWWSRFVAETALLADDVTGRDEKPVRLGRKNIRLLLDTESADGCVTLPVARVQRDGSGHFIFDPKFVPPCLQIGASERIMKLLRRLLDILEEKSSTLSRGKQGDAKTWTEYATRDIATFWLLHTVNSALAPLRHLYHSKRGHPEELYVELARLGGALCTFALESHPRGLPLYDHRRLDECFAALDHHIRLHLDTIVPSNYISIPLTLASSYVHEGQVTDQRCVGRSRWIFGIRSPIGEVEIIRKTPQLVKVCSSLFVPELVKRALPGLTLTHLPVPPSAIPARVDTHYFSVNQAGPCWDHIQQTRQVGVYVPGELPDPVVELLVILES